MNIRIIPYLCLCVTLYACGDSKKTGNETQEYRLLSVQPTDVRLASEYSASVCGRQDIEIRPQISGVIARVCVTEGERVRKGQTLFVLDQAAARSAMDAAMAEVQVARAEFATAQLEAEGKKVLFAQNIISAHELQITENGRITKKALLARAKADERHCYNSLSFTVIKSPSDGVVGSLPFKTGALVSPEMAVPMTTVSDNTEMYIYFSLTEKQILSLLEKNGGVRTLTEKLPPVQLRMNTGSLYAETGRIESISGIIDKTTGTVSVRAAFPNPKGLLLSGASAHILIREERKGVLLIPQAATYEIQDKVFVYRVKDSKAVSQEIKVSPAGDGRSYIVENGLQAGDEIVAEGVISLQAGTVVRKKND